MGDQNPFMTGGLFLDVLISNYWKIRIFFTKMYCLFCRETAKKIQSFVLHTGKGKGPWQGFKKIEPKRTVVEVFVNYSFWKKGGTESGEKSLGKQQNAVLCVTSAPPPCLDVRAPWGIFFWFGYFPFVFMSKLVCCKSVFSHVTSSPCPAAPSNTILTHNATMSCLPFRCLPLHPFIK